MISSKRLQELWPQLPRSAQQALVKAAELLAAGHSGTIEMRCYEGGVRMLREGREYRPVDMEHILGEDGEGEKESLQGRGGG